MMVNLLQDAVVAVREDSLDGPATHLFTTFENKWSNLATTATFRRWPRWSQPWTLHKEIILTAPRREEIVV
eukprot:11972547-Ditylum_brightwellii.AAC.1